METIIVHELVPGADTINEGKQVGAALGAALNREQLVSLSFSHIESASSSFVTASLIPSVRALGPSEFKQGVWISNASWQIEDIVRRRLEHELRMAELDP
jgi:hypothetical protein